MSTTKEALSIPERKFAIQSEFNSLIANSTWELILYPKHGKVIDNKWVFCTKFKIDRSLNKYKFRVVAKGFQQIAGIHYTDAFSPIKPIAIRIVLTLALSKG